MGKNKNKECSLTTWFQVRLNGNMENFKTYFGRNSLAHTTDLYDTCLNLRLKSAHPGVDSATDTLILGICRTRPGSSCGLSAGKIGAAQRVLSRTFRMNMQLRCQNWVELPTPQSNIKKSVLEVGKLPRFWCMSFTTRRALWWSLRRISAFSRMRNRFWITSSLWIIARLRTSQIRLDRERVIKETIVSW